MAVISNALWSIGRHDGYLLRQKAKSHLAVAFYIQFLAERRGFEPRLGYEPKHAFQACDLNHSSISPASPASREAQIIAVGL
jgi:hypothetical protein